MTMLSTLAVEKSSFIIEAVFVDEADVSVVPKTLKWTLIDCADGSVVNEREQVVVSSPAATTDILLQGNDLALLHSEARESRELILEGTYDGTLGADIPIKEGVLFSIIGIGYIT